MGSTMPSTIIVDPRPAPKPRNNILPRPFTTSERLHLGIIHNLDGPSERSLKIEADPARPQVMRFRDDSAMEDRSRIADGDHVVVPVRGELAQLGNHHIRGERWSGIELAMGVLASGQELDVSSPDINHKHVHTDA